LKEGKLGVNVPTSSLGKAHTPEHNIVPAALAREGKGGLELTKHDTIVVLPKVPATKQAEGGIRAWGTSPEAEGGGHRRQGGDLNKER
jgi:hypothetical protein